MRTSLLLPALAALLLLAPPAAAKGPFEPVVDLSADQGALWALTPRDLVRIDPAAGRILSRRALGRKDTSIAVAATAEEAWVVGRHQSLNADFATLTAYDTVTLRQRGRVVGMDAEPVDVALGFGAVWVLDRRHGRLLGFDQLSRRLTHTVAVGRAPMALSVGPSAVWVTRAGRRLGPVRPNSVPCTLLRIDPKTGHIRERAIPRLCVRRALAASRSDVWVAHARGRLTRVSDDADLPRATRVIQPAASAVAADSFGAWLTLRDGRIARADATGITFGVEQLPTFSPFHAPTAIAPAGGRLWVIAGLDGRIFGVDPATGAATARLQVGRRLS